MKKKQLFALLGAVIIAISSAACGNSGNSSDTGTAESQEDAGAGNTSGAVDAEAAAQAIADAAGGDTASQDNTSAADESAEASGFTPEDSMLSEDGSVISFPKAGITFTLPESFKNTKGFLPNGGGEIAEGDGVFCMYYNYIALREDDFEDLLIKYRTDSENAKKYEDFFNPRVLGLFSIYAADRNRSAEEINEYLKKLYNERGMTVVNENPMENAELIGSVGEYNFYFVDETQPDVEIAEDDINFASAYDLKGFKEEYEALVEDVKNTCTDLMEFSEPETASESSETGTAPESSEAGNTTMSFSTVDLDGQPVTSEDLFSNNKITMVNIWGTFCGPCINEMPELEKLYAEFAGQGCGIIGIVGDAAEVDDESIISDAKSIIADTGVTYPNILPWDGLQDQLSFNAFPTTYFVDSKGTVIGSPVVGAYIDQYSSRLREALESIEQ